MAVRIDLESSQNVVEVLDNIAETLGENAFFHSILLCSFGLTRTPAGPGNVLTVSQMLRTWAN